MTTPLTTRTATTLKLEGAAVAVASGAVYQMSDGSWLLFALLFLVPDVFMLGYLRNPTFGSLVYNLGHTYLTPLVIAGIWFFLSTPTLLSVSLIWIAHIGLIAPWDTGSRTLLASSILIFSASDALDAYCPLCPIPRA